MAFTPNIPGSSTAGAALPGLAINALGTVGGDVASQGLVRTIYDYNPYAILTYVMKRHDGYVSDFRLLLKSWGMTRGVDAPTTGHYEEDWQFDPVKINAVITPAGGAGQNAVLELHSDMMYNASQTANGVAVLSSRIEAGKIIEFGLNVKAIVVSKNTTTNPHRITVRPLSTTGNLATVGVLTGGASYAVHTNAHAEGTALPKGNIPRITKYTNTFQIVKVGGGVTGSELTNKLFVDFQSTEFNGTIFGKISDNMMVEFERDCGGALLFGSAIDNVTTFVDSVGLDLPVAGTEGAIDFARLYGHTPTYTIGSYAMVDFDAVARIYRMEQVAARTLLCLQGFDLFAEVENLLYSENVENRAPMLMKTFASQTQTPEEYSTPFEDASFSFYVGFKAVHKSGYTWAFKSMTEFNDARGTALSTYNYTNRQIIAPIGYRPDSKTGKPAFLFGYEYKSLNGYSREVNIGRFGGVGPGGNIAMVPCTSPTDYLYAGMLSEIAFHGACPNQIVYQIPV